MSECVLSGTDDVGASVEGMGILAALALGKAKHDSFDLTVES